MRSLPPLASISIGDVMTSPPSPLPSPVVLRPGRHRKSMTASRSRAASKRKRVVLTVLTVVVVLGILVTAGYFSESALRLRVQGPGWGNQSG